MPPCCRRSLLSRRVNLHATIDIEMEVTMPRGQRVSLVVSFSLAGLFIVAMISCGGQAGDGVRTAAAVDSGGSYQLVRRGSNKCLDSTGGFANLQQLGCTNGADQVFRVEDLGGGNVRLVNDDSGQCVDVQSSGS